MLRALLAAVAIAIGAIGMAPVASAAPPKNCSATTRCDIPQGDPDYAPWLDRDHDGIACEC